MNQQPIRYRLLAFTFGAILWAIGDYLYGTTYYTDQPGSPNRFLISGLLGIAASASYLFGLFGYSNALREQYPLYRNLIVGGLSFFTLGVAATHTLASAHMVVFNQRLLTPSVKELDLVFTPIDYSYEVYFIPMIIGLIVGYGALFIAILRRKTVFAPWTLWFHPLLLAVIIGLLDTWIKNYPVLLKSPAISAVVFNTVLILSTKKQRVSDSSNTYA